MLLGIFIIWGLYSFTQLSIDALPDVTNNQVQVITNSPNLATQEVEQFITTPLELEFKSLQGLVELRSTSRSGLSVITIVFKDNMPINITRQLVTEKIKVAQEYSQGIWATRFDTAHNRFRRNLSICDRSQKRF